MTTEEAVTPAADRGADPKRGAILAVIAVFQLMLVLDSSIVTIAQATTWIQSRYVRQSGRDGAPSRRPGDPALGLLGDLVSR
jgi:hypothetical protein